MSNYSRVIQKPMGVRKMEIYAKMTVLTRKMMMRQEMCGYYPIFTQTSMMSWARLSLQLSDWSNSGTPKIGCLPSGKLT